MRYKAQINLKNIIDGLRKRIIYKSNVRRIILMGEFFFISFKLSQASRWRAKNGDETGARKNSRIRKTT